ncbi:MAG TPA: ATP-binding protein [Micropepsaceae bacterium]|nr:ATP-binding protein [Micropepsaceae bacterium]
MDGSPHCVHSGSYDAIVIYLAIGAGQSAASETAGPRPNMQNLIPDTARDILDSIDEPLLLLDSVDRVVFANAASHSLIRSDAAGKRLSAVLRTPELLESIGRVQSGGAAETVAFTIPVPVERHFEAHVSRASGQILMVRIRDVSKIRRSEELRADFVANASHELRTPLASLSGFIDTLRGHAKDDPVARERFLEIMSTEANRMRRLIEDLLSLNRIEMNEHIPPSGEADVVTLVRDAADVLKPLADTENMQIDIEDRQPLRAVGDRDELTQVFQNLIHNAIKYGRAGGHVRVRFGISRPGGTERERVQVYVAVEDEGEGIPREAIPRLTERFYRVDVKRSRERGGTGLGLAIVKHILNRHRGRLEIHSVPGSGSTFTAWLPAA